MGSSPLRAVKRRVEILDEQAIDNLAACCDDFVCTSSPAVENSVRTLARDIQRADGSWTRRILAPDVVYKVMVQRDRQDAAGPRLRVCMNTMEENADSAMHGRAVCAPGRLMHLSASATGSCSCSATGLPSRVHA